MALNVSSNWYCIDECQMPANPLMENGCASYASAAHERDTSIEKKMGQMKFFLEK